MTFSVELLDVSSIDFHKHYHRVFAKPSILVKWYVENEDGTESLAFSN
jgi:hypothetical protein